MKDAPDLACYRIFHVIQSWRIGLQQLNVTSGATTVYPVANHDGANFEIIGRLAVGVGLGSVEILRRVYRAQQYRPLKAVRSGLQSCVVFCQ